MSRSARAVLVLAVCLIGFCGLTVLSLMRYDALGRAWQRHTDQAFSALSRNATDEAKKQLQIALDIAAKLGSIDVRTAMTLNDLADICLLDRDFAEAGANFAKAAEICKLKTQECKNDRELMFTYSSELVRSLRGQATAKRNSGDVAGAGATLSMALELTRSAPVDEHQARVCAADYMKIPLYQRGEKPEESFGANEENLWQHRADQAPDIPMASFLQDHSGTKRDEEVARAIAQGRYADAESVAHQLLKEAIDSDDVEETREAYCRLADLYFAKKQYKEAQHYLETALAYTDKFEGGSRAGRCLCKLSWLYKSTGRMTEAEQAARTAWLRDSQTQNFTRGLGLRTLLPLLWQQGKFAEADHVCTDAIEMYKRLPAKNDVTEADFKLARAEGLLRNKKVDLAKTVLIDCERTYREANEQSSSNRLAAAQIWLADCYLAQGNIKAARSLYQKGFAAPGTAEFGAGAYFLDSKLNYIALLKRDGNKAELKKTEALLMVRDPFMLDDIRWMFR